MVLRKFSVTMLFFFNVLFKLDFVEVLGTTDLIEE